MPKQPPTWLTKLAPHLAKIKGADNALDRLWTTRRGDEVFVYNPTDEPESISINGKTLVSPPRTILLP